MDQGGEKWRQVEAVSEGEDAYRITSINDNVHERWEFDTGTVVRCRTATLPGGERVLVAAERLDPGRIGLRPPVRPPGEGAGGASGW